MARRRFRNAELAINGEPVPVRGISFRERRAPSAVAHGQAKHIGKLPPPPAAPAVMHGHMVFPLSAYADIASALDDAALYRDTRRALAEDLFGWTPMPAGYIISGGMRIPVEGFSFEDGSKMSSLTAPLWVHGVPPWEREP